MIIISDMNFSERDDIPEADEYQRCNFSRREPLFVDGVPVGHTLTIPAVFINCNMRNVEAVNADRENSSGCIAPIMTDSICYGYYDIKTGEYTYYEPPREVSE